MKPLLALIITFITAQVFAQIDTLAVGGLSWGGTSRIQDLLIDNNENYWIAYSNTIATSSGVKQYDGTNWILYQTSNSGLPSNRVNTIIQDANNNYWLGTNAGLAKFDGINWTVYNRTNSGICSDTIYAIEESGSDLWLGTHKGLSKFETPNDTALNYPNANMYPEAITSLELDGNNLYMGTEGGIAILNASTITSYSHFFTLGNITSAIKISPQLGVVIATSIGVYVFNNGNYIPLEATLDICPGQNSTFNSQSNRKYIEISSAGSLLVNYGNCIVEFTSGQYAVHQLSSAIGILKRNGSKYSVLRYTPTLSILTYDATIALVTYNPIVYYNASCHREVLNINEVSAGMLDRGDMFWNPSTSSPGYEVPKGSGSYAGFAGSIWIGGKVNGQLRTSCQTYRQNGTDFWPGPLDTVTGLNPNDNGSLGVIMKVNRFDIQNFIFNFNNGNVQSGNFIPSRGILNWPAHGTGNFSRNTAPFVDVNSNGVYDPLVGGDYPEIKGDQMLYHIYNDASGLHLETNSLGSMGLEVRQKSYAYTCEGIEDSMKVLNYTTFYEFEIINRRDTVIDSMYISYWNDADLGYYNDDYIGCNVKENYGYIYNGDDYDQDGQGVRGYKAYLPCFSTAIIEGPKADVDDGVDNDHNGIVDEPGEQLGMSSFGYYNNDFSNIGNPSSQLHYYNYMTSKWKNNDPMTYGGNGNGGTLNTKYVYPGDSDPLGYGVGGSPSNPMPQPAWTELSAGNLPGDRRFLLGSGPFTLQAKDTTKIVYAMVFTQDSTVVGDQFACIAKNEQDVKRVRNWYNNNNFPSCLDLNTVSIKENKTGKLNYSLYPNPATNSFTLLTDQLNGGNTIEVYDIVGKLVMKENVTSNKHVFSIVDLASGIYIVKINDRYAPFSCKLIKQ